MKIPFFLVGLNLFSRGRNINKAPLGPITLKALPDNRYDPKAVGVFVDEDDQLGFVHAEYAPVISSLLQSGIKFSVVREAHDLPIPTRLKRGIRCFAIKVEE